jgi:hypothetical protein
MAFQTTVNNNIGFGVPGELFLEGPLKAQPARLGSADATNNVIARAFTIATGGQATAAFETPSDPQPLVVQAGGTGVFAGILGHPKVYANQGTTAGGTLAPNMTLPNGTMVELVQSTPGIIVNLPAPANIGDWVYFTNATGALVTTAPGAAAPGASTRIPGARVVRYIVGAAGMAVIALDDSVPTQNAA